MKQMSDYVDSHGKQICEGDIVVKNSLVDKCQWKYIVRFKDNNFFMENHFEYGDLTMYCDALWGGPLEILGNIYENPELIEEEIEYIKMYIETKRIDKIATEVEFFGA